MYTRIAQDADVRCTSRGPPCVAGASMEAGPVESLSVVYQSQDFLVVNKHWDLRIDSRMWRETPTLQKQLRLRFPELADPDTYYGFRSAEARHWWPPAASAGGKWPPPV